jgi:hypothetical protein
MDAQFFRRFCRKNFDDAGPSFANKTALTIV